MPNEGEFPKLANRRAVISAVAAGASVIVATTLSDAVAAADGSSREIETLFRRWKAAVERYEQANAEWSAADDRFDQMDLETPTALLWENAPWIWQVRKLEESPHLWLRGWKDQRITLECAADLQSGRLGSPDAWTSEVSAIAHRFYNVLTEDALERCGFREAERNWDEAHAETEALGLQIISIAPSSLADAKMQIEVVRYAHKYEQVGPLEGLLFHTIMRGTLNVGEPRSVATPT